ncbi:lonely Cys domain-containing protein, partial [Streptomyces sp. NPDC057717]|uniref:lonely Cys domain-containing protein n=1 Tax=Streptomyces sp. NPDC057717 TaxID=3346224 RepID=UPI0036BE7A41
MLSSEEFAGLLAEDPGLQQAPPGTPVLLLMPFGGAQGLTLPRVIAARLGREVWSFSGRLNVQPRERGGPQIMAHTRLGGTEPYGSWILSRPTDLRQTGNGDAMAGVIRTLDGQTFRDTDVISHTIVGPDYRPTGRSAHTPSDQASREANQLAGTTATTYHQSRVLEDRLRALPDGEREVPWAANITAGRTPYIVSLHGRPGALRLPARGRTVEVSGREVGRYLGRRPSVSQLAPGVPIVLAVCHAGTPGADGRATAQDIADETGRVVYAANASVGEISRVGPAPDGRPGVWKRFNPHTRTPAPTAPAAGPSPRQQRNPRAPQTAPWPANSARRAGTDTFQLPPAANPATVSADGSGQAPAKPVSTELTTADDDARPLGRDYTLPGERRAGATSSLMTQKLYQMDSKPGAKRILTSRAPWSNDPVLPFFVVAQGGHDAITVQLGNGTTMQLSPEEFAGLLAEDTGLRHTTPTTPVVLLVPFGGAQGLTLPRAVAARLGREVWSFSGRIDLQPRHKSGPQIIVDGRLDAIEPHGSWIRSRPTDLEQAGSAHSGDVPSSGVIRTLKGKAVRDTNVITHTLIGPGDRPVGRAAFAPSDESAREKWERGAWSRTTYYESEEDDGYLAELSDSEREVPWAANITAGRTPYVAALHGDQNVLELPLASGRTVKVSGREVGRYLRRRPSVSQLPPDVPIVLAACHAGTPGTDGRTTAQDIADETGHVVYAANAKVGGVTLVGPAPDGRPGVWKRFNPHTRTPAAGPSPRQQRDNPAPAAAWWPLNPAAWWPANSARRAGTGAFDARVLDGSDSV